MKREPKLCLYVLIVLILCVTLPAQPAKPGQGTPPLKVPKVKGKLHVNGVMDEAIWQKALKLELNYEVFPGENIAPPVYTKVYIAYSSTHFYVGFRAYDKNPAAIRARLTQRDNIAADDWVKVSLDTFNAQRRVYTFSCNPFGIQSEAVETNEGADTSWDTIWTSAGRIAADGYEVEMAIPFSSVRFQRKPGEQVWGFNAMRNYPRNLEHNIGFIPEDRNNFCYICQYRKIIGFAGVKAGKNIEIDPSLSALVTRERKEPGTGKWEEMERKIDPGLTAHWGFTPSMTLSTALNPDFSNVEADVGQLDINKQFALYYPEKRPLFLEGTSIFKTPLTAVYTRSLADPHWGVKITGKEKRHTLGFYFVRDNITNLLFPGSRESKSTSLDQDSTSALFRYRHDMGKESTVGLLFTHRKGGEYYNRLVGIDTYWRFNPQKFITFQFLASRTRYSRQLAEENGQPQDKISGTALDFVFRHISRNVGYYVNYRQVSPWFRADLGFMPQAGYRNLTAVFILAAFGDPGQWYAFMNAISTIEYETDFDGDLIYKALTLTANYQGPGQTQITLKGNLGKRVFMGNIFSTDSVEANFSILPNASLQVRLGGTYGKQVDYVNVRPAVQVMLNPGIQYKAGKSITISLDHVYEQLNVETGQLYTANVSNLQIQYHFNKRAFLRIILQYNDYRYNTENYVTYQDPVYKHLFSQVLFSYRLNPRTMLFLGYSDDYYGIGYSPIKQTNRTLFLKVGYALVL